MHILVTTDFSPNSKGALRFVKTLAQQSDQVSVTFYHVVRFLKPTVWSQTFYEGYKSRELARLTRELERFVRRTMGKAELPFRQVSFVVEEGEGTEKSIVAFAQRQKVDYLCVATRGAGLLRKWVGTHTAYLVQHSAVPVFVVPSQYRPKPLKKVSYFSDFEQLAGELAKITQFTRAVGAHLEVVHFDSPGEHTPKAEHLLQQPEYKDVALRLLGEGYKFTFNENALKYARKEGAHLLVMVTKKRENLFDSLFLSSKSVDLTYNNANIPMLIYPK